MHKIWLITKREYLSRVKKKSFIIMTLLGPLLIGAFYAIIIGLAINQKTGEKTKTIAVIDKSGLFQNKLENQYRLQFEYYNVENSNSKDIYGWLIIPQDFTLNNPKQITFKSKESATVDLKSKITNAIETAGKNMKLMDKGLSKTFLDSLKMEVTLHTLEVNDEGKFVDSRAEINLGLGAAFAFFIYLFIFLYGVQVMRGVMEEKTNRIVEIIISSVKPFQLMMGKIIGIALVGLTQFLIWVVLSLLLMVLVSSSFSAQFAEMSQNVPQNSSGILSKMAPLIDLFFSASLVYFLLIFVFYFMFGYLLYSSMFAAIGSAVDSESDTQQFMLPVTLPLIISFASAFSILSTDPHGSMATFMSIFPLTSPIIMMVRIPFNPPIWQVALSMISLIAAFILLTWLAGRIYRVGILMTGKKPTYKELFKWMMMK